MFYRAFNIFAVLFFLSFSANAQNFDQANLNKYVDGVFTQLKAAGATNTKHGAVTYEPTSGLLTISDVMMDVVISDPEDTFSKLDKNSSSSKKAKEEFIFQISIKKIIATQLKKSAPTWSANDISIEDIRVGHKDNAVAFSIKKIQLQDIKAPLAESDNISEQLRTFFSNATIKNMDFSSISLKDEKNEQNGFLKQEYIRAATIDKGIIQQTDIAEIVAQIPDNEQKNNSQKPELISISIQPTQIAQLNIGAYFDLISEKPKNAGKKIPLFSAASTNGVTMSAGSALSFNVGKIQSTNLILNMPQQGLSALLNLLNQADVKNEKTIEQVNKELFGALADWSDLTTTGTLDIDGVSFKSIDTTAKIKKISGKDIGANVGALRIDDISFSNPEASGTIAAISLMNMSYSAFNRAMMSEFSSGKNEPNFKMMEGQLPTIEKFEISKLNIQYGKGEPLSLDALSFSLPTWTKFVPTQVQFGLSKLIIPEAVINHIKSPSPKDLGYKSITTDADFLFTLKSQEKIAQLAPFKVMMPGIAGFGTELLLSGIEENMLGVDAFDDPTAALAKAKFEKFSMQFDNETLIGKLIEWIMKKEKKTEEKAKKEISFLLRIATASIPLAEEQNKANEALQSFMANPKNINLTITPKEPVTLEEFQNGFLSDDELFWKKLNFTYTVNK